MTPVKILILTAITVAFLMTANQAECAFEIFSHNSLDYLAEGSRNKYFDSRGWAFLQRTDKYSLPELAINSLEAVSKTGEILSSQMGIAILMEDYLSGKFDFFEPSF